MLEDLELLLRVCQLVDHQALNVAQALDHFLLHLRRLKLVNHLVHMRVLSAQVLLLQGVVLGLDGLMTLLFHRRGTLSFRAELARSLASDFFLGRAALSPHFEMIELFVQHHRLLHDGEVEPLAFLRLEVLESLLLQYALPQVGLSILILLLTLSIVTDHHELLRPLPLLVDLAKDSLLVPLQDAKARFERLQHALVFVLDALGEDQ